MDNTLDYVAIGKRIRIARKRRKWSIDKLALLSNISRPHMGHIETGATKLSLPALVSIANAQQMKLVSELAKVVLRDEFKPGENEQLL